jgi:hypothetical protein
MRSSSREKATSIINGAELQNGPAGLACAFFKFTSSIASEIHFSKMTSLWVVADSKRNVGLFQVGGEESFHASGANDLIHVTRGSSKYCLFA